MKRQIVLLLVGAFMVFPSSAWAEVTDECRGALDGEISDGQTATEDGIAGIVEDAANAESDFAEADSKSELKEARKFYRDAIREHFRDAEALIDENDDEAGDALDSDACDGITKGEKHAAEGDLDDIFDGFEDELDDEFEAAKDQLDDAYDEASDRF